MLPVKFITTKQSPSHTFFSFLLQTICLPALLQYVIFLINTCTISIDQYLRQYFLATFRPVNCCGKKGLICVHNFFLLAVGSKRFYLPGYPLKKSQMQT